jgi:hypothetical protein
VRVCAGWEGEPERERRTPRTLSCVCERDLIAKESHAGEFSRERIFYSPMLSFVTSVLGLSPATGSRMSVAPMLSGGMAPVRRTAPPAMQVQGGSRRTWSSYGSRDQGQMDEMFVELGSDGRPMDAEYELWQGPDNLAVKTRVYGDDGYNRRVYASVGTGNGGYGNTASIRNTGPLEFPIHANVARGGGGRSFPSAYAGAAGAQSQTIQGESQRSFTFDPSVGSVQVHCTSQGMPINAKIEILQGPNCDRQGIDLYSDDGRAKPVSYLLELGGSGSAGSTIQIRNTGPIAYPITVSVVPYGPPRPGPSPYGSGGYGGMTNGENLGGGSRRYSGYDNGSGRRWHERDQWGSDPSRRGPPLSFAEAEAQAEMHAGGMPPPPDMMPFHHGPGNLGRPPFPGM